MLFAYPQWYTQAEVDAIRAEAAADGIGQPIIDTPADLGHETQPEAEPG